MVIDTPLLILLMISVAFLEVVLANAITDFLVDSAAFLVASANLEFCISVTPFFIACAVGDDELC